LWLGKKAIQDKDTCYLVEGYMDVIAMHQSGIENVVASSGTSLTVEQIKSIHRFTRNIVVLYDGDEAGQKASNRAIPLLLEEGMNVRLLQFPNNDDPDSFSRKVTAEEFQKYIQTNTDDFLIFKAKKLKKETQSDPIKRATVIKDIVDNISLIPDNIIRSIYIKECSSIMEIEESVLQLEVNKIRRKTGTKGTWNERENENGVLRTGHESEGITTTDTPEKEAFLFDAEERELLRIMLTHGNVLIKIDAEDEDNQAHDVEITLAEYILFELWRDEISFENPIHQTVLDEFILEISNQRIPDQHYFANSPNPLISSFVINHIMNSYELSSKWNHFGVYVTSEVTNIKKGTQHLLFSLKEKKLNVFIAEKQEQLRNAPEEEIETIQREIIHLNNLKGRVNKLLGRVVVK
jgi:DNA primase